MSTMPLQLDPEELRRNLAITLGTQAPQLNALRGPQVAGPGPIAMPQAKPPDLSVAQPKVNAPRGTVEGDQAERSRLLSTGPGVDQISGKIKDSSFGQNHPKIAGVLGPLAQGLGKVGSLAVQMATPFGPLIPGTEEHHLALLNQANHQVGAEEGERQKEAETQRTQAATDVLRNPPDKYSPLPTESGYQAFDPKTGETKPLTGAQGQPLQPFSPAKVRTIDEQAYDSLTQQGKTPVEALDTIYGAKNTKTEDLPHLYLDALQSGDATKAALIKRAHEDTQVRPVQPPGLTMIVPQADGTQKVERLSPGQTVAAGAQTAAGVNAVNTPTMTQRTAAGRAATVVQMAPEVLANIDRLAPQLGPIEGRWNEFMQGKVGMDNPEFAGLRTDLMMLSSAVALAHAQGRLPENLRQEFDHMINAPKQTPENMKAVINHILPWLQKMQEAGQGPHAQSGGNPPAGAQIVKWEDVK